MEIEISISDEVFAKVEFWANRLGVTEGEFFCRAVLGYVDGCEAAERGGCDDDDRVREALDAVYSREDSSVDGVLARMQWASLPREWW